MEGSDSICQVKRTFEDFVNRYEQGPPAEGYSDQEVVDRADALGVVGDVLKRGLDRSGRLRGKGHFLRDRQCREEFVAEFVAGFAYDFVGSERCFDRLRRFGAVLIRIG